jgi:SAM-dependent methyltransferase
MLERPKRYQRPESALAYDRQLSRPDIVRRLSLTLEMAAFKRAIARLNGHRVLDAPCGTGRLSVQLARKFPEVVSLDSSVAMLGIFRKKHPQAMLCCGDAFQLPFRDGEWDWVVCYRLFHHFGTDADRVRLLRSVDRVCSRGIVFSAWVDTPLNFRRNSRRSTITRPHLEGIVTRSGLEMRRVDFAAWPFQPKCVVTCAKPAGRQ